MGPFEPAGRADPQPITDLLLAWRAGDGQAADRLFPLVYAQLRRIAHNALRRERASHTLDTTALIHEAYLQLVDQTRVEWRDRGHFFGVAAGAMRRVLIDYARRRRAAKRGGAREPVPLAEGEVPVAPTFLDQRADLLLAVDAALTRLEALDPRLARVVECRFFGGLTEEETAAVLGVTARTVRRDWIKAKGWLYRELANA
jgi:RNA polymerase sigma factor (TIGR02999 family)